MYITKIKYSREHLPYREKNIDFCSNMDSSLQLCDFMIPEKLFNFMSQFPISIVACLCVHMYVC